MAVVEQAREQVLQRIRYRVGCDGGITTRCTKRGTWLDVAATAAARESDPTAPAVHLCKHHARHRYPEQFPPPTHQQEGFW